MSRPWYASYPADFAKATQHLTFVEDAAHRRLLYHYYQVGKLPANAGILLRVCRAIDEQERAAVAKIAREFFTEVDNVLVQERAEFEIARSRYLTGIRAESGRKGADKTNLD